MSCCFVAGVGVGLDLLKFLDFSQVAFSSIREYCLGVSVVGVVSIAGCFACLVVEQGSHVDEACLDGVKEAS